jgi:hypothetical protein
LMVIEDVKEPLGLCSVRSLDEVRVLVPTWWKRRQAGKVVHHGLTSLGLAQPPDKTLIGRIARGFDVLEYHFSSEGPAVAKKTRGNFVARGRQHYEQEPGEGISARLDDYVRQ